MANHTIINTSAMMAKDVDALNKAGIYADADVDNGTIVTLAHMNVDSTSKKVAGYEYSVALGTANMAAGAEMWIAASPEVTVGIEQIYVDPREFTNKAGRPIAIKNVKVGDTIEVTAPAFASGALPTATDYEKGVATAANGKLGAPAAVSGLTNYAYFRIEALGAIGVGNELVPSVFLRRVQ